MPAKPPNIRAVTLYIFCGCCCYCLSTTLHHEIVFKFVLSFFQDQVLSASTKRQSEYNFFSVNLIWRKLVSGYSADVPG